MRNNHKQHHNDPWEQEHYGTGDTNPPGKKGGIMAFVLVAVILAVGIARTMNVLNLHFWEQMAQNNTPGETISLFPSATGYGPTLDVLENHPGFHFEKLDLMGQTVSDFDRRYYEMPQGVQVTEVTKKGSAHNAGLRAGDVLLSLDGKAVESREDLLQILEKYPGGSRVQIEYYRPQTGKIITAILILS